MFDLYASAMKSCLPKRLDAKSVASSASNPREHQKHGYSPVAPALTNGANADELLQMKMQISRRDEKVDTDESRRDVEAVCPNPDSARRQAGLWLPNSVSKPEE